MSERPSATEFQIRQPDQPRGEEFARFWQVHQDTVRSYFWYRSNLVILMLAPNLRIVNANWGFARLVGEQLVWLGQPLQSIVAPESLPTLEALPGPGSERQMRLTITCGAAGTVTLTCHLYHLEEGYVLFGERPLPSQSEVIKQLAGLTSELTNISRELAQKNRELAKANAAINQMMRTDPLTGLANRRHLMEHLATAVSLALRHGTPLTVIMADLDHFKSINDTWGHDTGDQVLQKFGNLLKQETRLEDLAARYGGEEFVLMLPHTDLEGARCLAERIQRQLATVQLPPVDRPITASFGLSQVQSGDDPASLLKRADQALYRAKTGGRNRVEIL